MRSIFFSGRVGCTVILFIILLSPALVIARGQPLKQDNGSSDGVGQVLVSDGPGYRVSSITIQYVRGLPFLPSLQEAGFLEREIELSVLEHGYAGPRSDAQNVKVTLKGLEELFSSGEIILHDSALDAICRMISDWFEEQESWRLILVAPSPEDIDPGTGQDLRKSNNTRLRILMSFEGASYPISRFNLAYTDNVTGYPGLSSLEEVLSSVEVKLTPTDAGFVAWRPDIETRSYHLSDLNDGGEKMYTAGAIQRVLEGVLKFFTDRHHMAIQVAPAANQLDFSRGDIQDSDLRQDRTDLDLLIIIGMVTEVRTLASGERIPAAGRVNNPKHKFIRKSSPFQRFEGGDARRRDLLNQKTLDEYLYRLSRHPGRRVDAALAPADDLYGISLDYTVGENKELVLFTQVSDTGTEQTDRWRYRFGLFHNQVTGNDDLFNFEYSTAGFDETHALTASYEAKVFDSDYWRWRVFGLWSQFSASDVGFASQDFSGESWQVGGELVWNIFQDQQLFLDLVGGARYENIEVKNKIFGLTILGEEDFFIPYVGLRLERYTEEARTDAMLRFEWNLPGVTGVNLSNMAGLGRTFPDKEWYVLKWDGTHSFYLDSLFTGAESDPAQMPTLAHELSMRFRGQYAFDDRLIPQQEQVAGGLYSVRGYPESVVAGDSVLIGTVEYRFHLAQALGHESDPGNLLGRPFRWKPQFAYGPTDWDLIFRGFFDIGRVLTSDPQTFESNETLIGVGLGLEFQYRTNMNFRVDWGVAMEEVPGRVKSGDNEVHFVATFVF